MTDKLDKARAPRLNYENVAGLPAGPTLEQEALASIAQSLKRLADYFASPDTASAAGGGVFPIANRFGKEPCGECHLQPGERCDICGARAVPVQPAPAAEGGDGPRAQTAVALGDVTAKLLAAEARIRELESRIQDDDGTVAHASAFQETAMANLARAEAAEASLAALRERMGSRTAADNIGHMIREWLTGPNPTAAEGLETVIHQRLQRLLLPTQPTQDDDSPVPAPTPDWREFDAWPPESQAAYLGSQLLIALREGNAALVAQGHPDGWEHGFDADLLRQAEEPLLTAIRQWQDRKQAWKATLAELRGVALQWKDRSDRPDLRFAGATIMSLLSPEGEGKAQPARDDDPVPAPVLLIRESYRPAREGETPAFIDLEFGPMVRRKARSIARRPAGITQGGTDV